ncbi:hypothetical protein FJZ19_05000 [Candidatus Pacearchaeota archaeon]|nr:hypothetical protein [Candidatus Pacearchaeota archaeon]
MKKIFLGIKANWLETWFWKVKAPSLLNVGVELRAFDILKHRKSTLEPIKKAGCSRLHFGIPQHMPIILSTIMNDRWLDIFDLFEYADLVKAINPDLLTTIEISLYDGDTGKLEILNKQFFETQLHIFSEYKNRVVVLIPGRTREESLNEISMAYHLGYRKFGLACADPMQRNQNKCKMHVHRDLAIIKQFPGTESYILGLTSPKNIEEFSEADFLVTKGWYYSAWKFKEKLAITGATKDRIYPILKPCQTYLTMKGCKKMNIDAWNKIRHNHLRKNAFSNIQVLLEKLYFTKKQTKLKEFTKCLTKEVKVLG